MATPAIIAVTPGIGINLDAVSLTVGPNTVVRETMVIADPNVAGNLVAVTSNGALTVTDPVLDLCVTANVLAVFLPTATVSTLTPPTAAAIAAAIVANPPAVTFTGGTITAVTSITNPVTVQQATAANLKATVSGTGVFIVQDSVLDACVTANIVAVSLPTATVITLTPPTAAAIAAAIVSNPPAVLQGTSPWVVAGNLTHNNAAPTTNNLGVLPAIANAAHPTYTEGDQVLLSTDLTGALRVNISGTISASNNVTEWNTVALGSPTAFGTAPSGNVIGVNAELFQGTTVVGSGNALYVQFPSAQAVTLTSTTITGTVSVTQGTSPWVITGDGTAGTPGTAVVTVQGIGGGTAIPVSGTFYQATQPVSIASGQVASGAFASGSIASGAIASGAIASGAIAAGAAAAGAFADGSVYVRSNAAATFPVTATIAAAQKIEVYDGTNTATVKAASTAAVATDTAVVVTEPGSTTAGACANTAVTSTSSDILAANTARREAVIVNTDVVVVFIGLGQTPTATAYHVALKPCTVAHDGTGGSFVTDTWKGQINAITASTSGHVAVTELT